MSEVGLSTRSRALFGCLGAAVLAGAAGVAAYAANPSPPPSRHYSATFARAGQGLDGKSDVKVRGVTVGNVESVKLTGDGHVRVRLRVDRSVRIPRGAEARVDPVSVFGPKEISLDFAGSGSGPYLADGDAITRTHEASDLSETATPAYRLSKAIDPDDVVTLTRTLSEGLNGQGQALRRTIGNGSRLADLAASDRAELQTLIGNLHGLSGTFQGRGDAIVRTSRDASGLTALVGDHPDRITALLDQAGLLSGRVGDHLRDHGANAGNLIDDLSGPASVVAANRARVSLMTGDLTRLFEGLGGMLNGPGPSGYRTAMMIDSQQIAPCGIFIDLCTTAAPAR
ncbi:MlaD family protein [Actinomadura rupiterrae]|uniref:MlaD family protein n=1 Tax=Actinomadura rupiterrae TaxID=559627 RepID=UPI0020A5E405|nr:MlaD family protein [Actinomadura rupiterrae]MCP2343726.1 phospholipid/cholesterol/gamma-HCH transport system substrate-binding protein [Actinomadura rupiterrae]